MSMASDSSIGRSRVERDDRRHQLGERRDRRDFVGALAIDGAMGRRVDDDGVDRRELELARIARVEVGRPRTSSRISSRKTR
jgi:hypothetical protein